MLLVTSFIDRYINFIFPEEQKMVPYPVCSVFLYIIQQNERYHMAISTQEDRVSLLRTASEVSLVNVTVVGSILIRA